MDSQHEMLQLIAELALGLAGFAGVSSALAGRERVYRPIRANPVLLGSADYRNHARRLPGDPHAERGGRQSGDGSQMRSVRGPCRLGISIPAADSARIPAFARLGFDERAVGSLAVGRPFGFAAAPHCGIFCFIVKSFQIESRVRVGPSELWETVVTPEGVNAELWPLLRMTFPGSVENLANEWRPNETLFRSWILLFGVIPVEYDDLAFAEVDEGRRFLERSRMLTQERWQHEREIFADPGGSRIVDRVSFQSRTPALEGIQLRLFALVFRYRHFRLRSRYGSAAE